MLSVLESIQKPCPYLPKRWLRKAWPRYQILICLRKLLITVGSEVKRLQRRLAWKSMRAEKMPALFNFVVLA